MPDDEVRARRKRHRSHADRERERDRQAAPQGHLEAVADAANRPDQLGLLRVLLDLRPQSLDRGVDEPGVAEVVVVPDELQQELAREHLLGPLRQLEQELELRRGQLELLPLAPSREPGRVDLERWDVDHRVARLGG